MTKTYNVYEYWLVAVAGSLSLDVGVAVAFAFAGGVTFFDDEDAHNCRKIMFED